MQTEYAHTEERRNPWLIPLIVVGVVGSLASMAAGWFLLGGAGPAPVPAPTGFQPFTAADKSFACEAPQGWNRVTGSANAVVGGALFSKGAAKIDITSDLAGSLMGDVAAATNNMMGNLGEVVPGMQAQMKPPIEKLHEADAGGMKKKYANYEEQPMRSFQTRYSEGRYSEYTGGKGFFQHKVHGYRATLLGSERRITVICEAPEADWAKLKPAFERVLGSMAPGGM